MAAAAEYVFSEIADLVTADVATRVRAIHEEHWVTYPRAKEVLSKLERLFDYPPRSRMPCLLIVGRPGMGQCSLSDFAVSIVRFGTLIVTVSERRFCLW